MAARMNWLSRQERTRENLHSAAVAWAKLTGGHHHVYSKVLDTNNRSGPVTVTITITVDERLTPSAQDAKDQRTANAREWRDEIDNRPSIIRTLVNIGDQIGTGTVDPGIGDFDVARLTAEYRADGRNVTIHRDIARNLIVRNEDGIAVEFIPRHYPNRDDAVRIADPGAFIGLAGFGSYNPVTGSVARKAEAVARREAQREHPAGTGSPPTDEGQ